MKKRKYVFVGLYREYDKICFYDLRNDEKYIFMDGFYSNKILDLLQKIMCSEFINSYYEIPFKEIFFFKFPKINRNDEVFFIFLQNSRWLLQYKNGKYIDYLHKNFVNGKIVLYLRDLVSNTKNYPYELLNRKCDYVISYDQGECKKFGFINVKSYYSQIVNPLNFNIQYDVYFCGKAKGREQELLKLYDKLSASGFICLFFITNVPKNKIIKRTGIIYNKSLSYKKNIELLCKSKCILEVIQNGSTGETLRVMEAITYNKKLISNNDELKKQDYYNPSQIIIYKDSLSEKNIQDIRNNEVSYSTYKFNDFKNVIENLGRENEKL